MKLAILVATGSKSDALAGRLLSGNQGAMLQDLLGRNGIGWESVKVFSMLPFPRYAAPANDAEGMERYFEQSERGVVTERSANAASTDVTPLVERPSDFRAISDDSGQYPDILPTPVSERADLDKSAVFEPILAASGGGNPQGVDPLGSGIAALRDSLIAYQPTMILALGTAPLRLLKPDAGSVVDWRGGLFESDFLCGSGVSAGEPKATACPDTCTDGATDPGSPVRCSSTPHPHKCLATYHPTWIQRDGGLSAYLKADIARCAQELKAGPGLMLPKRKVFVASSLKEALQWITSFHVMGLSDGRLIANDTEGVNQISMFGFAMFTNEAYVIPFIDATGRSIWTEDEEAEIWEHLEAYLKDPKVRKVWQNWQSDAFLLAWSYGIITEGLAHDVMLMAWEAQPELEKGLASVASIYVPGYAFWKERRNGQYVNPLDWVCGMDAMLTLQCCGMLDKRLRGGQRDHYQFNVENLPHTLYQMLEGLPFDKEQTRHDLKVLEQAIYETQYEIDKAAYDAIVSSRDEEETSGEECSTLPQLESTFVTHPSLRTARLAEWFGAVGGESPPTGVQSQSDGNFSQAARHVAILALATAAFATARHSEKVEVTEERWQLMRWKAKLSKANPKNAGRWVKDGKLRTSMAVLCSDVNVSIEPTEPDPSQYCRWLKPSPRTITVSRPVPIDSWETLERFCKESCEGKLRRVKRLVKKLDKYEPHRTATDTGKCRVDGGDAPSSPKRTEQPVSRVGEKPERDPRTAILGELSILFGIAINSNSNNQGGDTQWLLHEAWGLPKKLKKTVRDETEEDNPRLTTDNSMLLTLYARCQQPEWHEWKKHSALCRDKLNLDAFHRWLEVSSQRLLLVLKMRKLIKERCYLDVATDSDGHVRYGLNLVQTATGRFAAYGSPTGKSKLNPQTVGKKHRHLYHYENTRTMEH